jgi:hypothetical protein
MFRHTVMFKWLPDTTPEQQQEVRERAAYLLYGCPTVLAFDFGDDLGADPANHDFVAVFDFEDRRGFEDFDRHPAHLRARRLNIEVRDDRATARVQRDYTGPPSRRGMIRHIGMYRWEEGITLRQQSDVLDGLEEVGNSCPTVRALHHAPAQRTLPTDLDWAVEIHFDDLQGYGAMTEHPAYAAVDRHLEATTVWRAEIQHRMLGG